MYTSQISTILDYCSSIWVHIKASECDLVQNRAIRYFLGVHGFTPIPALNGEMGWLPCKFRRYLCAIRFWNRLQKMDNCRLTKVVFLWDLKNHKSNWSESVKNIFIYLDMTEDFMHQNIVNLKIVKSKLFNLAEKEWRADVKSKPKLKNYEIFKTDLQPANYLQSFMPKFKRSLFAQFRTGVLPLHIETGRYHLTKDPKSKTYRKLNVEERTCLICNMNSVEDEIHFLCHCPMYEEQQKLLFTKITQVYKDFLNMPNENNCP